MRYRENNSAVSHISTTSPPPMESTFLFFGGDRYSRRWFDVTNTNAVMTVLQTISLFSFFFLLVFLLWSKPARPHLLTTFCLVIYQRPSHPTFCCCVAAFLLPLAPGFHTCPSSPFKRRRLLLLLLLLLLLYTCLSCSKPPLIQRGEDERNPLAPAFAA